MGKRFFSFFSKSMLVTATALVLACSCAFAAPILKMGSHGTEVVKLQKMLLALGYNISAVDGDFGNNTMRALRNFQRDNKLKITDKTDSDTWAALNNKKAAVAAAKNSSSGYTKKPSTKNETSDFAPLPSNRSNVSGTQPFLMRSKVPALLQTAKKCLGVPYVWGGTTPRGFDCSGFLQYVFAMHGYQLPRLADEQYLLGQRARMYELEAGDLVFFSTYEPGASHCGIYIGSGKFIHASSSRGIAIDELTSDYWVKHYYGGKHIVK